MGDPLAPSLPELLTFFEHSSRTSLFAPKKSHHCETFTIFTGRNEVVAKVMFLQASVILSTGGGYLSAWWDTTSPQEQTPPQSRHPPNRHPPGADTSLGADTPSPQEQTPTPPPQADTSPPEQTPPPEAGSGIRSMSGRYASYWNACLLISSNGLFSLSRAVISFSLQWK